MEKTAISDASANILILLTVLTITYLKLDLIWVILAYLTGDILSAVVAASLGFRLLPVKLSLVGSQAKYLITESLPMGAILIIFSIYNRVDTVMLSYFKGQEAVGFYGAAYRIFEVLILGAAYFSNAVLPLISRLAAQDKEKLGVVYKKSFVVLFYLGIVVAIINFVLAPIGILVVAGGKFLPAVPALQILSLAVVVSYFNHLNGYTLIALGKQRYSLSIALVALVINLVLNLIFIPRFSFLAAAFITFITEGLIVLMTLTALNRLIGLKPDIRDVIRVPAEFIKKRGRLFDDI